MWSRGDRASKRRIKMPEYPRHERPMSNPELMALRLSGLQDIVATSVILHNL
ncbi:hypothetical protein KCP70_16405 [Salmonella enterica subsp. enterica]|nr:hypothetical protein KCP70_16405 [Salmonella enterica subsp. enterica]